MTFGKASSICRQRNGRCSSAASRRWACSPLARGRSPAETGRRRVPCRWRNSGCGFWISWSTTTAYTTSRGRCGCREPFRWVRSGRRSTPSSPATSRCGARSCSKARSPCRSWRSRGSWRCRSWTSVPCQTVHGRQRWSGYFAPRRAGRSTSRRTSCSAPSWSG